MPIRIPKTGSRRLTPKWAHPYLVSVQVLLLVVGLLPMAWAAPAPAWLSQTERDWLASHREIRLAPAPDFSPVEFFNGDGAYRGLAADYMAEIERMLDIRFEIVQKESWPEVLRGLQSREVDMVAAAAITPAREQFTAFTRPYLELPAVIITRANDIERTHMEALAGRRVAVVEGYAIHDWVRSKYPEVEAVPVPSIEAGLRQVSYGRVDAIIETNASALYYIERNGLTNLHVAGDSGFVWRLAVGVRSDWPILRDILQKALDRIPATRRTELMKNWVALNQYGWAPSRGILLGFAASVAVVLLLAVLAWNRSLKRLVNTRTQALEDKLREVASAEQIAYRKDRTFNQLFAAVDLPLVLHELNGDLIQLNDKALDAFGLRNMDLDQVQFPRDFVPKTTNFKRLAVLWERVVLGEPQRFHLTACQPLSKTPLKFRVCCRRISLPDRDAVLSSLHHGDQGPGRPPRAG